MIGVLESVYRSRDVVAPAPMNVLGWTTTCVIFLATGALIVT
jgi:hypothetical protein